MILTLQPTIKNIRQIIRECSRTSVGVYPLPSYLPDVRSQHLSYYLTPLVAIDFLVWFFVSDFCKRYLAFDPEAESTIIAVFPRIQTIQVGDVVLSITCRGELLVRRGALLLLQHSVLHLERRRSLRNRQQRTSIVSTRWHTRTCGEQ